MILTHRIAAISLFAAYALAGLVTLIMHEWWTATLLIISAAGFWTVFCLSLTDEGY